MSKRKDWKIETILKELERLYGMEIDPGFWETTEIDSPALRRVERLLAHTEEGIRLTPKGNLPTKIVRELVECCPTAREKRFQGMYKRFYEEEHFVAMFTRDLCEMGFLLRQEKKRLVRGERYDYFRSLTEAERFVYLLWYGSVVNLGAYDLYRQNTGLVQSLYWPMLQILRDKESMFRSVEVYAAFLLYSFPQLETRINEEIQPELIFQESPFDTFVNLLKVRIFERAYSYFGLIEERGLKYTEVYEARKSRWLDRFLVPVEAVDTERLLDRRRLQEYRVRFEHKGLTGDLFGDLCFLMAQEALDPSADPDPFIEDILQNSNVSGLEQEQEYRHIYREIYTDIQETFKYFSQVEMLGIGERAEKMKEQLDSFVDGLVSLLPMQRPFPLYQTLNATGTYLSAIIQNAYGITPETPDMRERLVENFGEELTDDIMLMMSLLYEGQKRSVKEKRVKGKMKEDVRQIVVLYLFIMMEIRTME